MELETHAAHQQNDPQFRELLCDRLIGDEPRCHWTYGNPGKEVSHDGRQAQALAQVTENKRRQASCQGRDEVEIVHAFLTEVAFNKVL